MSKAERATKEDRTQVQDRNQPMTYKRVLEQKFYGNKLDRLKITND